jgi:prepilin-type N-terminal cleavage/methylation domain-containing protein
MPNFSNKNRGFTLIELSIVMVLMAIVVMVAMVIWPTKAVNVDQYAERLAADLRYAQHLAQTTNQRLRFNFAAGSYSLTLTDGTTAVKLASGNTNSVTLPTGMTITLPPTNLPSNYVVFDAMGRPYTTNVLPGTLLTSVATITITQNSLTDTVTIQPRTGKIQ